MNQFVTVEGRTLRKAMKLVSAAIERRNAYPILGNVRMALDKSGLHLTGTNLDVEITAHIDVIDGNGEWVLLIDAGTIDSIAAVAGVMPIKIERITGDSIDAHITLGDGGAFYRIPSTIDPDGWPELKGKRAKQIENFTNGMLAVTLNKVAWAISSEETRYYLNGVCWQIGPDGRRMVATDGHRLGLCRYSPDNAKEPISRIIPRQTVGIIAAHLSGEDVTVFATDNELVIEFVTADAVIRTKLIDGSFPDVNRVIPQKDKLAFRLDLKRQELVTAIDQAMAIGRTRKFDGRAIRFFDKDGRVALERKSPDFGTAHVTMSSKWFSGAKEFGFNASYLRQMVAPCQGDVEIAAIDAGSPFMISDEDESMTRVIMPMRV